MAEATVRSARAGDAAAIRAVGRAAWHAAYDPIHGPETVDELFDSWWSLEDLREGSADPDRRLLVAVADEEVRVMIDASPHPDLEGVFRIDRLYVHPEKWDGGLGTRLVDHLRERLPDEARTLRLVVLAENDIGTSFYESYGFERVGRRVEERGDEAHEEYVYELEV